MPTPGQVETSVTVAAVEEGEGVQPAAELATPTPTSAPPVTPATEAQTTEYTVKAGETLFSIAQRLGTDVETLRRLNNLTSDAIAAGQVLKVPVGVPTGTPPATPAPGRQVEHIVQRGEYLALIANRYGVSTNAIIKANNLRNPNFIYPGQKLIIPVPGITVPTATPASGGGRATSGKVHIVQRGETLQSIALKYGVTVRELAAANGIRNPNFIYVGQKLVIP